MLTGGIGVTKLPRVVCDGPRSKAQEETYDLPKK